MNKLIFYVFGILLVLSACKKEQKKVGQSSQTSAPRAQDAGNRPNITVPANMTPVSGPPVTDHAPQNAKGVWHYTCPKGCPGGAGDASPCSKCGLTLVHNPIYHQ